MKSEDLMILGAAGFAVWAILRLSGVVGSGSSGSGFTLKDLVSSGNGIGAYIPTEQETAETGIKAGSLMNTGMGGGYLTGSVQMGSLMNTGQGGGFLTLTDEWKGIPNITFGGAGGL